MSGKLSKVTVSLSDELCRSIDVLCRQLGLSRSRLVETCLREHPSVEAAVRRNRGQMQAKFTLKKMLDFMKHAVMDTQKL